MTSRTRSTRPGHGGSQARSELHEAWCLLYIPPRDPKMVFAQLDWLTRPLLQAAAMMAAETRPCLQRGHHGPGNGVAADVTQRLDGHR